MIAFTKYEMKSSVSASPLSLSAGVDANPQSLDSSKCPQIQHMMELHLWQFRL